MYLLYLDESGSHVGSSVLVLAGVAVQEQDVWFVQRRLETLLRRKLPQGLDPGDFELHAAEIKSPTSTRGRRGPSNWAKIPPPIRSGIMRSAFGALGNSTPQDARFPIALFGAVVDSSYGDREQRAYEEVLHRFDEMLTRQANATGTHQRGIVIHDRRVLERDVQGWVDNWRRVAGRIGRLTHLVDVPMFSDSRASRLIQAADFVAWGLYRQYSESADERWIRHLWSRFDACDGIMHGLAHVSPAYRACQCRPCASRHAAGR
jgi:uncharacterized protein DUF3800